MGAPAVYKSTDANMPNGYGAAGLKAVLDCCLVDGTAEKASLGWSRVVYDENNTSVRAAYQMPGGSGRVIEIGDDNPTYQNVRGWDSLLGVGVGVGPFPATATPTLSNYHGGPWVLVGTETFFYFFAFQSGTSLSAGSGFFDSLFFGDPTPYNPDDTSCSMVFAFNTNTSNYGRYGIGRGPVEAGYNDTKNTASFVYKSADLTTDGIGCLMGYGGGPLNMPYADGDPTLISRPYFFDNASSGIRFFLPGLFLSCQEQGDRDPAGETTVAGKDFLFIFSPRNYDRSSFYPRFFIDLSGDFWGDI